MLSAHSAQAVGSSNVPCASLWYGIGCIRPGNSFSPQREDDKEMKQLVKPKEVEA